MSNTPPSDPDTERVVLGACISDHNAVITVFNIISENTFYLPKHQVIYRAILAILKSGNVADVVTVSSELKKMKYLDKVGGATYIAELTNKTVFSGQLEVHARILVEKELKREIVRISHNAIKCAYDDSTDVFDLIDRNIQESLNLTNFKSTSKPRSFAEVNKQSLSQMHAVLQSGKPSGIPSGINYIDKLTNGWQKTDLIILAARPSMGKTATALKFALYPAQELKKPTAFFSLEMSSQQLVRRINASESYINVTKIVTSSVNKDEYSAIEKDSLAMNKVPFYIDDTPGISLFTFKQKAKKLVIEQKVELIVIDYLQLMSGDEKSNSREQEISTISRGLKQIAKELDIPIIALSQLSRQVENRPGEGKKPKLSDLRESGAIEQDADMVMFLYRPEYYGIKEPYKYYNETLESDGLLLGIVSKNRNGALGEIPMKFIGQFMRIENFKKNELDANPVVADKDVDFLF